MASYANPLHALAKPSYRIVPSPLDEPPIGSSRLGGLPDLPADFAWPQWSPSKRLTDLNGTPSPAMLSFIAQINLSELPQLITGLPSAGWLYFFFDAVNQPWGFDPADRLGWRVLFYDGDAERLAPRQPPLELPSEGVFRASRITFEVECVLPNEAGSALGGRTPGGDTSLSDAYFDLLDGMTGGTGAAQHRLLGEPRTIQNPMELECQLASHGLYCGGSSGYLDPRVESLRAGAADWSLLLQIDSEDENTDWMWGDCGRIYYWIRRSDLRDRKFDAAWLCLQCY